MSTPSTNDCANCGHRTRIVMHEDDETNNALRASIDVFMKRAQDDYGTRPGSAGSALHNLGRARALLEVLAQRQADADRAEESRLAERRNADWLRRHEKREALKKGARRGAKRR